MPFEPENMPPNSSKILNLKDLKIKISKNKYLKQTALWLLTPPNEYRPRWWVRNLWNPFRHHYGRGAIVKSRLDVFPFHHFEIGEKTLLEDFSLINNAVGAVKIGNRCLVGVGTIIIGAVEIEDDVLLAQHVVISALNHNFENIQIPIAQQGFSMKKIHIESGVWVGANAVITAGVHIGRNSIVAAGSVVTRDVPPFTVVGGNPAKVLKQYNPHTQSWEKNNQ